MQSKRTTAKSSLCRLLLLHSLVFSGDGALFAARRPIQSSAVNVSVDASQTIRTIDARLFGVNAAIWDSSFNTPTTLSLLSDMDNQMLRFPGGSLSDEYHWATNTSRNNTWTWATSFDAFANIALQTRAQVFMTANYGSGTAQEAADWVRYSNVTKNYGFKYWEVGNEIYGSWEYDTHALPHDPYTYATQARDYIAAMKAVDPTIKVGVVVTTGEDSYANYTNHPALNPRTGKMHNGWTPVLLATLKSLNVTPDFAIYHRYEQAPGQESDSFLLQSSQTWQNDAANLRQQLNDYLGAAGASVELLCTEHNSVYSNPGKQTTSLVNGLFLADSLGQILKTEFNALVWWDLRNGQETNNNNSSALYGWRAYGDYGMLSPQSEPYPTYYVAKLLKNFARGGDSAVQASSDNQLLAVYAAKRANGSLSLLFINKSPNTALTANVSLNGYAPASHATVFSYGIPQDDAARTGTGSRDVASAPFDSASAMFTYTFPPYSATVISLSPQTASAIDDPQFFVAQHYSDFLNREPDQAGLNFWTNQITSCNGDPTCIDIKRQNVSAAFFLSIEFQQTGYFVYKLYKAAYGDINPPTVPVPVRFANFLPDVQTISNGVVVGADGWQDKLEANKQSFVSLFVARSAFTQKFDAMSNAQYVNALNQNAGGVLSPSDVDALTSDLNAGTETRATVLRKIAENNLFSRAEFNRAFVLMQYFGYLRRDPDSSPDTDFSGYNFWLSKLNQANGDYIASQMVRSFIVSPEYRKRFGAQ